MSNTIRTVASIFVLTLLVAACGDPGSGGTTTTVLRQTTTTIPDVGGDRLPVQQPDEEYGHFPAHLTGDLRLEGNGCWAISLAGEERIVIFPPGFTKSEDGRGMVAPDGTNFSSQDSVDLVGGLTSTAALPGVPDGYWGNYVSFCDAAAVEVVVADALTPSYDPTTLSDQEKVEKLESADLSQSWPCGLGFTASTPDQEVALYIHPNDFDSPQDPTVVFPTEDWSGTVVIGKNLMVNHCDDVAEFWEPERIVAAEWPIVGGELEFEPGGDEFCSAEGPVTALFTGIVIETPSGPVPIEDLSMVNDAYGCFAG